jgi:hypothetical protein
MKQIAAQPASASGMGYTADDHKVQGVYLCRFRHRSCTVETLNPFHSKARTAPRKPVCDLEVSQQQEMKCLDSACVRRDTNNYRIKHLMLTSFISLGFCKPLLTA